MTGKAAREPGGAAPWRLRLRWFSRPGWTGSGGLQWNTVSEAADMDAARGACAVDSNGSVFVTGWSESVLGLSPFCLFTGEDGFVAKFAASGGAAIWNTFMGSPGDFTGVTRLLRPTSRGTSISPA